jgi:hypothetical protein
MKSIIKAASNVVITVVTTVVTLSLSLAPTSFVGASESKPSLDKGQGIEQIETNLQDKSPLKGCRKQADGTRVCPSDLGAVKANQTKGVLKGCRKQADGTKVCPDDL